MAESVHTGLASCVVNLKVAILGTLPRSAEVRDDEGDELIRTIDHPPKVNSKGVCLIYMYS